MLKALAVLALFGVVELPPLPMADFCQSFDALMQTVPPGALKGVSEPVTGDKAKRIILAWNAMPPASNHVASEVRFAIFADGKIGIALIDKGCVVAKDLMPPAAFKKLMETAEGAGI